MKRILMYSYKGGTGRTVATANVAAHLAKRGNKVLCIDIDTAGPGLHVLFEVKTSVSVPGKGSKGLSIQEHLSDPSQFPMEDIVIDVSEKYREALNGKGRLQLITATTDYNKQERLLPMLEFKQIGPALNKLCVESDADIVLIDSPSGYHEMTKAGLSITDHVMFFFRFSRQHILGTRSMGQFFNYCEIDYSLVASAVPADLFQPVRTRQERYLNEKLKLENQQGDGESLIKCTIPEHKELKWAERILIFDKKFMNKYDPNDLEDQETDIIHQYEALAKHIESLL